MDNKSDETSQNGNNEITMTKVRDPEKEKAIGCLRMSFLFPMIISLTFCVVDIAVQYTERFAELKGQDTQNFMKWIICNDSLGIMLGYFPVTLITMALFMFIQQFYYRIYAGLDEHRAMTMLIIAIVNLIIYPVYISVFSDSYGMTLTMCFFVVLLGGYMWKSLGDDVRSVSKYPSNKGGHKAFTSSNC